MNNQAAIESARRRDTRKIEAQSILSLVNKIDRNFSHAVNLIYRYKGR